MVVPCVDSRKPSGRGSIDAIVSISLPVMVLLVTLTWNPSWAKISLTSGARRTMARASPMAEVSSSNAITIPLRPGMWKSISISILLRVRRRESWMASSKKREPHGSPCPTPVRVYATMSPALLRTKVLLRILCTAFYFNVREGMPEYGVEFDCW